MLAADVFHTKVVDAKGKRDGSPSVRPETRGEFALVISLFVEAFLKELLGNEACVGQSICATVDLDVDVAVGGDLVGKVVCL